MHTPRSHLRKAVQDPAIIVSIIIRLGEGECRRGGGG